VHAPSEEKSADTKDGFYKALEQVFDRFPQYHIKFVFGNIDSKLGRKDIFKPTIGNENLLQDSNDNGVRVVNFAT
jgi:hypothetical protein